MKTTIVLVLISVFSLAICGPKLIYAQQQILTLDEALSLAEEEGSLKGQYDHAREAARQDLLLQKADYWPTLQFRVNLSHANEAPRIPVEFENDTALARQGTRNTFISRLELSQMVYDFGKTRHAVDAARMQTQLVSAEYDQQHLQLRRQVRRFFYQSLYYQKLDSVYAEVLPLARELARIHDVRIQNGVALSAEALEARVTLQNIMSQQTVARNEYRRSLVQLASLTGRQHINFETRGPLPAGPGRQELSGLHARLYQEATELRADIGQLQVKSRQQAALAKSIEALKYPTLILQSDFSYFGPEAFGYYSGLSSRGLDPVNWRVGIGFTYPLFDGRRIQSQKNRALALQKEYREQAYRLERQISSEIQAALSHLENLYVLAGQNRLLVDQSEANIATAEQALAYGNISRMEYLKIMMAKTSAAAALLKTKSDIAGALLDLETTVGKEITRTWHTP
ncbi:TolC family protein [Fodinibius sediminis]|uniref:Outer membrane protein TolC n=1 Tax=Fodinibius sediminis TaxID=1214077 RepID=A0A521BPV3_9BACT|nr:TolC family protein [Fodinibius sediminis]SMO49139.1 Outer membrane protein TolC [Fodinibius sediminis]